MRILFLFKFLHYISNQLIYFIGRQELFPRFSLFS
nr:MAG TPA: hypothetical protein [Crassvirales sp.]DAU85494.1 MAG TPA: hypothetical protein [Crassvirales sp.]